MEKKQTQKKKQQKKKKIEKMENKSKSEKALVKTLHLHKSVKTKDTEYTAQHKYKCEKRREQKWQCEEQKNYTNVRNDFLLRRSYFKMWPNACIKNVYALAFHDILHNKYI